MCVGIRVSEDGWVPNDMYDAVKMKSEEFTRVVLNAAETEFDRAVIVRHWPFADRDEDE